MERPWFENSEELLIKATAYFVGAIDSFKANNPQADAFYSELGKEFYAKLIFESNKIEGEGLSEGETKKLVLAEFEKDFPEVVMGSLKNAKLNVIKVNKPNNMAEFPELGVSVKYQNNEKEVYAVVGHLMALLSADGRASQVYGSKLKVYADLSRQKANEAAAGRLVEKPKKNNQYYYLRENYQNQIEKERFLTEKLLKEMHDDICIGNNNNENGNPGEYRPGSAYIDDETIFLEPALIGSAMRKMVSDHYSRLDTKSYNPIIEACRIKEEFIKIHPFGDFNGRISRIVLSGFLKSEGYPFFIILRGNTKEKKRYITAMKNAYRGNPLILVGLVSMIIIEQIESINNRLSMAGIEAIAPARLPEEHKNYLAGSLKQYKAECKNLRI